MAGHVSLTLDLLTTPAALHDLAPAWDALWQRVPNASPFASPAWLLPWWRQFGTPRPLVATLAVGERLLGIIPLYELPDEAKVLPFGVGLTDEHDALIASGAPPDAASRLLSAALDGAEAAVCDLPELVAGAHLLAAETPWGWGSEVMTGETSPVLRLGPDLRGSVPSGQHRNVRQSRHRAERLGGWRADRADDDAVADALTALLDLNAARWPTEDGRVRAFQEPAMLALCRAGAARIERLWIGGRLAAACFMMLSGERTLFFMQGFDPEFAAASPGMLLIASALEAAIAEGRREAWFLRGGESYKYGWGAQDRRNSLRRLTRG